MVSPSFLLLFITLIVVTPHYGLRVHTCAEPCKHCPVESVRAVTFYHNKYREATKPNSDFLHHVANSKLKLPQMELLESQLDITRHYDANICLDVGAAVFRDCNPSSKGYEQYFILPGEECKPAKNWNMIHVCGSQTEGYLVVMRQTMSELLYLQRKGPELQSQAGNCLEMFNITVNFTQPNQPHFGPSENLPNFAASSEVELKWDEAMMAGNGNDYSWAENCGQKQGVFFETGLVFLFVIICLS